MASACMISVVAGAISGIAILSLLRITRTGNQSGALLILLAAIAIFYPVFAIEGANFGEIAFHSTAAALFIGLASWATLVKVKLLPVLIGAHGLFDMVVGYYNSVGPDWWPSFCAVVDVTIAAILLIRPQWVHPAVYHEATN